MKKIIFLLIILLSFNFISALTEINNCAVLNKYGETYKLTRNILNSRISKCIDITANNIVLDCQGYMIQGNGTAIYGIYLNRISSIDTRVNVMNCTVTNWNNGIILINANKNIFNNINVSDNNGNGIEVVGSSADNAFFSIFANKNYHGFNLDCYKNMTLINVQSKENTFDGILVQYECDNNVLINLTSIKNGQYGISFYEDVKNTIIKGSHIEGNSAGGIYLDTGSLSNNIYNNFFNNSVNVVSIPLSLLGINFWNTTLQSGTRIYSNGAQIGGNFWAQPDKRGYSQICADANTDGFCDTAYKLADNNIDYLPLSTKYIAKFIRGDANMDRKVNIADPSYILNALFKNDPIKYPIKCQDAIDANDDGKMDVADANYLLSYLFKGGPKPPMPFPNLGIDPTADSLDCRQGI